MQSVTDRTIGVIGEPARQQIRGILLAGFTSPQSNQVRHKLSDAISEVAKEDASPAGTWNELIPALFEATRNEDPSFRESAFRVFASPELIDIPILMKSCLCTMLDLRMQTMMCVLLLVLPLLHFSENSQKYLEIVVTIITQLVELVTKILQNGQDHALASVLEALIDLVELAPKMFKDMFPTIIEFCSAVAK